MERLKRKLIALNEEEARLGRLFMEGKISEGVYDQLRGEWQAKTRTIRATIKELEIDVRHYLDDLEVALVLLTNISTLILDWMRKREPRYCRFSQGGL